MKTLNQTDSLGQDLVRFWCSSLRSCQSTRLSQTDFNSSKLRSWGFFGRGISAIGRAVNWKTRDPPSANFNSHGVYLPMKRKSEQKSLEKLRWMKSALPVSITACWSSASRLELARHTKHKRSRRRVAKKFALFNVMVRPLKTFRSRQCHSLSH